MKSLLRKVAVVGVAVGAVIGGAMAYALWSASGSGEGSSQALSAQTITVAADTPTADLYPGFTGGDVFFTVTNDNPYPVTFTSMTPSTITSSSPTLCPSAKLSVASPTNLSIAVPAHASATPETIVDVVTLDSTATDDCQGVTFTIALTLTGSQS